METQTIAPAGSPAPAAPATNSAALPWRPVALVYRVAAFALIATGIIRITGLLTPSPEWNALLFYTVLSNLLCLVWVAILIVRTVRDLRAHGARGTSTPSPRWSAAVMMAITVTMFVYVFVLVPMTFKQGGDYEPFSFTDNLIHVFTPIFLIVDWLLFVPKGRLRAFDPLLWTLIPYAYLVFALIYGGFGGEFVPGQTYPYPFLDVAAQGVGGVALWVLALSVVLIALGYVYFAIDRLLARVFRR